MLILKNLAGKATEYIYNTDTIACADQKIFYGLKKAFLRLGEQWVLETS